MGFNFLWRIVFIFLCIWVLQDIDEPKMRQNYFNLQQNLIYKQYFLNVRIAFSQDIDDQKMRQNNLISHRIL